MSNRLLKKTNDLTDLVTTFEYNEFDDLIKADYREGMKVETVYRTPDRIGALYKTWTCRDREYDPGGKLLEDPECYYHYDVEGNLIFKEYKKAHEEGIILIDRKQRAKELGIEYKGSGTGWRYDWYSNGMLKRVVRPDGKNVDFWYDALGRRTAKSYNGRLTRWVWDGNTPLHEHTAKFGNIGELQEAIPSDDLITWIFEDGTFVPVAKITKNEQYSIVTDYLGTPIQMYDQNTEKTWDCTLDIYGKVRIFEGSSLSDCPFRYQGQYEDEETGLYYNRFRYYDSNTGSYLSQDPIRLAGCNLALYGYVCDTNCWIDTLGLRPLGHGIGDVGEKAVAKTLKNQGYEIINVKYGSNNGIDVLAKNPTTGKYDVFEVKSSMEGNFTFSKDQLNPDSFVNTRLEMAVNKNKISSLEYDDIMANLGDKKVAYVDIRRASNNKLYADSIRTENWDTEANKIKGEHH